MILLLFCIVVGSCTSLKVMESKTVAYVGYMFNMSNVACTKISLPNWLYCEKNQILGLPHEINYGETSIFTVKNKVTYYVTVKYCHPWWRKLSRFDKSQMFVAGLKIRKQKFTELTVKRQTNFIRHVKTMMNIEVIQNVIIIPSEQISSTVLYITKSSSNIIEDYLTIIWSVGEDAISNISLKSLQILETKFAKDGFIIDSIPIQQWFVGFIRQQHKWHYRRSVGNPELIAFIEGSGFSQSGKANQLIQRTPSLKHIFNNTDLNNTLPSSWPVVISPLLPIKTSALQIMNYVIPENTFEDKTFKSSLKINVYFNNNSIVSNDPTRWISFNHRDQNIRINPKLINIGETVLKVCAYNAKENFVCEKLVISVSSPPPQNHQIYVSKSHKDYLIRYTIPLAWFRRFGVKNRQDIFVEKASGNSPFDWDSNGNLEILDIASSEGKLIELMLKVLIKNESQISIHLTLPVVAINRQKIISGPLYRSSLSFRPDNQSEKKIYFHIRDVWEMLKKLADYIGKFLDDINIKVQIFSPLKSPLYFDKVPGQRDEILIFDWFFHVDNDREKLCLNPRLDKVDQELLFRSFSSFIMINLTIQENRFGWVCPYVSKKDIPSTKIIERNKIKETTIRSILDAKSKAENDLVQRIFPNFQYTNFTVTAGLPFKSYVFRKNQYDKKNIKSMRLEFNPEVGDGMWISLSVNNDFLFGLPLEKDVRETPYKLWFIVSVQNSKKVHKIGFLVNVINFELKSQSVNHKVKIVLEIEKEIKIDMNFRWRLVTQMDKYVRERCELANDCGKDLILIDFGVETSTRNTSFSKVTAVISFLSLLAMDNHYCPKLSLIRLYDKVLNTASSTNIKKPNFAMKYLFSKCRLGEVSECDIILSGACKGVELQPPDLGQITVYAMVPFHQSLRELCLFYNATVWFTIIAEGSSKNSNLYHDWISVNEESTSLVGIASPKHVKADPYLLELVVHSNTVRQIISPRIAVTVRAIKEHPLFNPYIHQPNHQVVITLESIPRLTLDKNYLLFKFLFAKLTDQFFRIHCIKNGFINATSPILPCGSNLVFQSISKIGKLSNLSYLSEIVTFKFSIISELIGLKPIIKRPVLALNGYERFCPIDKLIKLHRGLLGDNGSGNSPVVLPAVKNYYYKANLGKIKDIKFEFLGSCSTYQYSKKTNLEVSGIVKSQNQPRNIGEDRHMFLMATIVPTCSFIIISLCVGLLVACCLQKKNQKFQASYSNDRNLIEFPARGGTSPIILAGEYQHSYMPPSRPLILPNEKPPVSPPDYIAENNSLIIADEQA